MTKTLPKPIRVLVVDDSELVRQGIKTVIATQGRDAGIEVAGEAGTAASAVEAVRQLRPDVVLLDIRLPDGSGLEICRQILREQPGTHVLVLTSYSNDNYVYDAVIAGAQGYLMKEIDPAGLIETIVNAAAGKSVLAPDVAARVLRLIRSGTEHEENPDITSLSAQERRVLALVADGKTNKEIGEELTLSENTVKNYLVSVFEKLHVKRRSQAAAIYVQQTGRTGK